MLLVAYTQLFLIQASVSLLAADLCAGPGKTLGHGEQSSPFWPKRSPRGTQPSSAHLNGWPLPRLQQILHQNQALPVAPAPLCPFVTSINPFPAGSV